MQDLESLAIDPNLLLVLDALLQEQNVSRAAERLARTQPAVSHALARLREQLGDPLLVRVGQRLVLTPRAEALREPLHRLLLELAALTAKQGPFDPQTSTRGFTIVASDYILAVMLPQLFADLRAAAPSIDLMFRAVSGKLYHDLSDGGCDLAFAVRVDDQANLKIRKLFTDRYVCLVSEDHPDVGRALTLDLFLRLPHAFVAPGGTPGGAVDRALTELGHTRRVAVTVPHFFVAPAVVERTDLVITLPERIADIVAPRHRLRKLPHPLKLPPFDVLLAWHERVHHDPGNAWLREQVARAIRKV